MQDRRLLGAALRYLGVQLRQARLTAGKSQKAAADHLEVKYQTVWSWESGRHEPKPEHLRKLIDFYGVSGEDFDLSDILGAAGLDDQKARIFLGQKMTKLREEADYTQSYVAVQMSGHNTLRPVDRFEIARYEEGSVAPDSDFLDTFASIFGLTQEALLGEDTRTSFDTLFRITAGFVDAGSKSLEREPVSLAALLQGNAPAVFEMEVAGSGLEAEGIKGGDRVFIDPDANLAIGKLFAIKADDRVTIRKLDIDNDGEVIVASSEDGQIGLKLGDPSIELLGRVVGIFHLL
jgi:transcriptional regulator with XRE-family HTH domain